MPNQSNVFRYRPHHGALFRQDKDPSAVDSEPLASHAKAREGSRYFVLLYGLRCLKKKRELLKALD
jgi:hypothetical protein